MSSNALNLLVVPPGLEPFLYIIELNSYSSIHLKNIGF